MFTEDHAGCCPRGENKDRNGRVPVLTKLSEHHGPMIHPVMIKTVLYLGCSFRIIRRTDYSSLPIVRASLLRDAPCQHQINYQSRLLELQLKLAYSEKRM